MLFPKPQLFGSLVAPSMQVPLNELAGNAQLVKSARICVSALLLGFLQRSLLAMIMASLSAWSACLILISILIRCLYRGTYTCGSTHRPGIGR